MNKFLELAYLFFIGSVSGWVMELFFRRFFSGGNPDKKWINPGLCTGPYLPIYGCGLCVLYLIASLERYMTFSPVANKALLLLSMAACMTLIEYIAGLISLKMAKVRLWDYSDLPGNIQGIICPQFSLIWAVLGAVYYFLLHPYMMRAVGWLSRNLAFSFVIGLFFGVFIIDLVNSSQLVSKLKGFADEYQVVVRYENIKANIRRHSEEHSRKYNFFRPFRSDRPLSEHLKDMADSFEKRIKQLKE